MPNLTISFDYQIIHTALECGLTPNQFRLLEWGEQAELLAYYKVKGLIDSFYQDAHQQKRERWEDNKGVRS